VPVSGVEREDQSHGDVEDLISYKITA
jgi:hypothetical protein